MPGIIRDDLPSSETLESSILAPVSINVEPLVDYGFPLDRAERSKSPNAARDVDTFHIVLEKIVNAAQQADGVSPGRIEVLLHHPDKKFSSEIISVMLLSRQPGAFGSGGPNQAKVRALTPRLIEEVDDPENVGLKLQHYLILRDNEMVITNWALHPKVANDRALWLEDMFQFYGDFFQSQGFSKVIFLGRGKDENLEIEPGSRIFGRPMRYYIRTQRIYTQSIAKLRKVEINLSLNTEPVLM